MQLSRSPAMTPLQRPVPELPTSRPLPSRRRQADRNVDGNGPVGADAAGHLAAAGRRNLGAGHVERGAVGRAAMAGPGGEGHVPGPVIGARPGRGRARTCRRQKRERRGQMPRSAPVRLKFEKDVIDWAEMLIWSCRSVMLAMPTTSILSSVEEADLTVHRCQNELVLP